MFKELDRQIRLSEEGSIYLKNTLTEEYNALIDKYIDKKKASSIVYAFLRGADRKKMQMLDIEKRALEEGILKIEKREKEKRPELIDACAIIDIEAKPEYILKWIGMGTRIMQIVDSSVSSSPVFNETKKENGVTVVSVVKDKPHLIAEINDYDDKLESYRKQNQ